MLATGLVFVSLSNALLATNARNYATNTSGAGRAADEATQQPKRKEKRYLFLHCVALLRTLHCMHCIRCDGRKTCFLPAGISQTDKQTEMTKT